VSKTQSDTLVPVEKRINRPRPVNTKHKKLLRERTMYSVLQYFHSLITYTATIWFYAFASQRFKDILEYNISSVKNAK
jgi:hypothetical protein